LGALRAQLRLAREIYNSLRRADIDFHRRNGRGPTLAELRQLALDLRKRNEGYQQLHSQVAQGIADRFHSARRRFLEGVLRARTRESGSDAGRQGLRVPGLRLEGRSRLQRVPQRAEEGRVGATRSACGAPPSARGPRLRARWGREAGSPALQGGVAHKVPVPRRAGPAPPGRARAQVLARQPERSYSARTLL